MLSPIQGLFETHLTVARLDRAIAFYRDVIGLELATVLEQPRVAFFWIAGAKRQMLGLWDVGGAPIGMQLHLAFTATQEDVLASVARLEAAGITPLDLETKPTREPVVIGWMPCLSIYFRDPDGHLLEYIAVLDEPARPDLGVLPYSQWLTATARG